jgi:hypothetical protein
MGVWRELKRTTIYFFDPKSFVHRSRKVHLARGVLKIPQGGFWASLGEELRTRGPVWGI